MNKLEVFFDYSCPFCLKGHENLIEIIDLYPQIEIVWCPCEAHPRPESHGKHSDLCLQGMFFALDEKIDIWAYHDLMYKAAIKDRVDIEDVHVLANIVKDLLDSEKFVQAILSKKYEKIQQQGNKYAFSQSGVWAIPSYRMDGKKLDAIEGIGVTKIQLTSFLDLSKK